MQIKNRIEKLEQQLNVGSEFCACNGSLPLWKCTYADDGIRRDLNVTADENCDVCGRAVNQSLIVVNIVSSRKPNWMIGEPITISPES
jgi:hypothetical protein